MLKYLIHDLRWWFWQLLNPNRTYGEFYSNYIFDRVNNGEKHPTLSQKPRDEKHYAEGARKRLEFLKSIGLSPEKRFIDYGCGGLRMGKVLIPYLETGNYWGIDVTDLFFREAIDHLDEEIKSVKSPRFDVISPDILNQINIFSPDFIYVGGVLHHVPPKEVGILIKNLSSLISENTKCVITNRSGSHGKRLGFMRWAYNSDNLKCLFKAFKLTVNLMDDPIPPVTDNATKNTVLIVTRETG